MPTFEEIDARVEGECKKLGFEASKLPLVTTVQWHSATSPDVAVVMLPLIDGMTVADPGGRRLGEACAVTRHAIALCRSRPVPALRPAAEECR